MTIPVLQSAGGPQRRLGCRGGGARLAAGLPCGRGRCRVREASAALAHGNGMFESGAMNCNLVPRIQWNARHWSNTYYSTMLLAIDVALKHALISIIIGHLSPDFASIHYSISGF